MSVGLLLTAWGAAVAGRAGAPVVGFAAAGASVGLAAAAGASVGLAASAGLAGTSGGLAAGSAVGAGAGGLAQAAIRPTTETLPARLATPCRKRRRLTGAVIDVVRIGSDMNSTSARRCPAPEWR